MNPLFNSELADIIAGEGGRFFESRPVFNPDDE